MSTALAADPATGTSAPSSGAVFRQGQLTHVLSLLATTSSVLLCTGAVLPTLLCFGVLVVAIVVFRVGESRKKYGDAAQRARWSLILNASVYLALGVTPGFALTCLAFGGEVGRVMAALLLIDLILKLILNVAMGGNRRLNLLGFPLSPCC